MPGVGPRRRKTLLTKFGSLGRRPSCHARGIVGGRRARKWPMPSLPFSRVSRNLYSLPDINFAQVFISFIVLLFSLTVHEMAHAFTADRLGDPTARLLGRISLNPIVHADPIGTILFPLIALMTGAPLIGWAKPVPVDVRRLRHHRRDYVLVAAAGPASNLVLALLVGERAAPCCRFRR